MGILVRVPAVKQDIEKWRATQRRAQEKYRNKPKAFTAVRRRSPNIVPRLLFTAQRWFNKWIVLRDGRRCVTWGKDCFGPMEASHVFPVSTSSPLRFDPTAVYCQCQYHNQDNGKNPDRLKAVVIARHGAGHYRLLWHKHFGIKKWSIDELRGIIQTYSDKVQALNN